jgi:signal transduction histidine kinase/ABC-type multidrug transport system ATPase subunit
MTAAHPHVAPDPPLLRVSGLSAGSGAGRALIDVDLTLAAGEIVALAGEPGAGKTTFVRCIAGDLVPAAGELVFDGEPITAEPPTAGRRGVAVVWQDLALCDNLDVAGNLLLGQETRRLMFSQTRLHAAATSLLEGLRISVGDTTQLVGSLSAGRRQLVAVAKAMSAGPRLLVLDEPTVALGVAETGELEQLLAGLRDRGTTILLATRDIQQMFRLADRIVVLRRGRVVAEVESGSAHPDDVAALLSGRQIDSSARRQLTRLHGLAGRLVSADPSSSLPLILSALGAALGAEKACIHIVSGAWLVHADSLGLTPAEQHTWARLPLGPAGGPAGIAASQGEVVDEDLRTPGAPVRYRDLAGDRVAGAWAVPVMGPAGVSAVITIFRADPGPPQRDELDLLTLYAGYAASAVERDRLLDQVTARNRVLETIREMLETLAGPVRVADGLASALASLRRGLQADEVALLTVASPDDATWRAYAGPSGADPSVASDGLRAAAFGVLGDARRDGSARRLSVGGAGRVLAVPFLAPGGPTVLAATFAQLRVTEDETALIEDAAHSLRLALEREESGVAHQEAAALRRSRELQRGFLSRLSHELRTPLTAIRGYASSLLAPDVAWDADSVQRFLERIAAESARVGRLVDDLLDFSAIESGVMRLQRDWCDIRLVIDAAVSCLPPGQSASVTVACAPAMPVIWADHDRLEQVFVNLLTNALRHNPPGTRVTVAAAPRATASAAAAALAPAEVQVDVVDDGAGFPAQLLAAPFDSARRERSRSAGAGLGLSIARGIIVAHGGTIELVPAATGTAFRIRLPVEAALEHAVGADAPDAGAADAPDAGGAGEPAPRVTAARSRSSEPARAGGHG